MAAEVIAVNQDPLAIPGDRVWKLGPAEVRPKALIEARASASWKPSMLYAVAGGMLLLVPSIPDRSQCTPRWVA